MTNVESAAAAGDNYNLRSVLLADGTGAIVGAALGCPFPPAVYIGQPGWKAAGGRMSLLARHRRRDLAVLRPRALPAARRAAADARRSCPILLFIGLVIGAQAFQAVPHGGTTARSCVAILPNIAAWARRAGRQRAGRRRDQRGQGRRDGADERRRRLRAASPRSAAGAVLVGTDPRLDHGVHHRPAVPLGGRLQLRRRGARRSSGSSTPRRSAGTSAGRSRSATRSAVSCSSASGSCGGGSRPGPTSSSCPSSGRSRPLRQPARDVSRSASRRRGGCCPPRRRSRSPSSRPIGGGSRCTRSSSRWAPPSSASR